MSTAYGLPRIVANLLRLMEAHKECLKWNITEGSHKITLTLTWSFRKANRGKESLWDRVQRTLKLSRSMDDGPGIPPELMQFLEMSSPPRRPPSPHHIHRSPSRRPNLTRSLSHTLPPTVRINSLPVRRQASFPSFSPPPSGACRDSSRFSWPGASSPISIRGPPNVPKTSTPNSCASSRRSSNPAMVRSQSDASPSQRLDVPKVRITYRTEEDLERSLEDIMERTRKETQEQLDVIRQEWNRSMRNWPKLVRQKAVGQSSSDSDTDANIRGVNDTVQKCLNSCDKILFRNSTLIT